MSAVNLHGKPGGLAVCNLAKTLAQGRLFASLHFLGPMENHRERHGANHQQQEVHL